MIFQDTCTVQNTQFMTKIQTGKIKIAYIYKYIYIHSRILGPKLNSSRILGFPGHVGSLGTLFI